MYSKDGNSYFIVDAHVHLWDGRASNHKNVHGKQFIDCFYDYHRNLSPEEEVWDYDTYTYYGGDRLMRDLFVDGYVDQYSRYITTRTRSLLASARTDLSAGDQAASAEERARHYSTALARAREAEAMAHEDVEKATHSYRRDHFWDDGGRRRGVRFSRRRYKSQYQKQRHQR